jgi:hypothetical protein
MTQEEFILAVKSGGIEFAITEWILHSKNEEFLHLWPLMEQEYTKIIEKNEKNK